MVSKITLAAIEYNKGDVRRINHLLKVYAFAKTIAQAEKLDEKTQRIVELAAVLHDIGIHESERKYGPSAGRYQELEGPPIARKMLIENGADDETTERVCFLIGRHHTYNAIDGIDFQILVEADFIVNIHEDKLSAEAASSVLKKHFKTISGIAVLKNMYCV